MTQPFEKWFQNFAFVGRCVRFYTKVAQHARDEDGQGQQGQDEGQGEGQGVDADPYSVT